jgi:hypothetical protein
MVSPILSISPVRSDLLMCSLKSNTIELGHQRALESLGEPLPSTFRSGIIVINDELVSSTFCLPLAVVLVGALEELVEFACEAAFLPLTCLLDSDNGKLTCGEAMASCAVSNYELANTTSGVVFR